MNTIENTRGTQITRPIITIEPIRILIKNKFRSLINNDCGKQTIQFGSIKKTSFKSPLVETLPGSCFVKRKDYVQQELIVKKNNKVESGNVFHRAGPTEKIAFEASRTNVAIVNAGGLCPGINNVLYDLVYTLEKLYHIDNIYGIRNGFSGLGKYNMLELSVEDIEGIQHDSGSLLGTSRGALDVEKFSLLMDDHGINQLYVIGGNGTHKGAFELSKHTDVSVVCIPKTIDNDLPIIDKSFGYETAVEQAKKSIMSAYYEAKDTENGLGIVKVMGRHCGWIALSAVCRNAYMGCVFDTRISIPNRKINKICEICYAK